MKILINKSVVRRQLDKLKVHCKVTPSGCWEWQRSRHPQGYGQTWAFSAYFLTHRLSLKFDGRLIRGQCALHRCDNPPCCNPAHLYSGTMKDNMDDMRRKGRQVYFRGEKITSSKLTANQVKRIRKDFNSGADALALSIQFKVSRKNIRDIISRKSWKHL